MQDYIKIRGARVHNLRNVSLDIPKNKLVVITGLSGSGKSSLAFDTIYAEGQRRYVESLSAYARQFLGVMDKPDVDQIDGLSPAIAIDQKSVSRNPRSTLGTITEVYDYLRLLFARIGKPFCPNCETPIARQTASQIVDQVLKLPKDSQIIILGPMIRGKKGEHEGILQQILKAGFVRVRIDGVIHRVDETIDLKLDKKKKHDIEVVVDRIDLGDNAPQPPLTLRGGEDKELRARLADSVETALKLGKGIIIISQIKKEKNPPPPSFKKEGDELSSSLFKGRLEGILSNDIIFSELFACQKCGFSMSEIAPRIFSFNSPYGACPDCQGLGSKLEIDTKLILPNPNLTLGEGAIRPWATASHRVGRQGWYYWQLAQLAQRRGFPMDAEVKNLKKSDIDAILYGSAEFEGVIPNLQRRWKETDSDFTRAEIEKYMIIKQCPTCQGKRLKPEALAIKILPHPNPPLLIRQLAEGGRREELGNGVDISQVSSMSIEKALSFFKNPKLNAADSKIAHQIIKEILARLRFLIDVGLEYLTIDRQSTSLSGGESQRIRLATQIGSGLSGVLYILDEPSVGLHQRDMGKLIKTLKELRDLGNTVIVVEHDEQTIRAADWVIDVGPGAGENGGRIIFEGTIAQLTKSHTLTADYLSRRKRIVIPVKTGNEFNAPQPPLKIRGGAPSLDSREGWGEFNKNPLNLEIKGAAEHNLKNIDVKIPLEKFICVTGVSGSGKSTLINDILGVAILKKFYGARKEPGRHKEIKGFENLDKAIIVDQSPIGRTPRSNPATYTGTFTHVRDLFAQTNEARLRGYAPGRFSFNVKGGRCETCQGDGYKKIEMYFLPDVYVECEECRGKRYNKEALEIEYNAKNIAEVLDMSIDEAHKFFKNIPAIKQRLETLAQVGLGYMKLGQPATTLSGGEAQRIKLATELARRDTGRTLYILDEPTTGLHFDDINKLLNVLHALVSRGNSVLVIEHNPEVIKTADWIIDLGPEGGEKGGNIVAEGTIKDIIASKRGYTGKYLG